MSSAWVAPAASKWLSNDSAATLASSISDNRCALS